MQKKNRVVNLGMVKNRVDPFVEIGSCVSSSNLYWKWGVDNQFPQALSLLSRQSATHRRIINDKADYISGRGFSFDEKNRALGSIISRVNGNGDSLRQVLNKLAFDKCLFGNAFVEVVTNSARSFVALFHQDATKCRLSKDKKSIILYHDWSQYTPAKAKEIAVFPTFKKSDDGTLRSMIHYKDYEPMFENYGVPPYIAGLNVSAIAYKTDKWNISRLDNSFQLSGVMMLDAGVDSEDEAAKVVRAAESKFAGTPGQVMFLLKESTEHEGSKFIPISSSNEGDWKSLHEQATGDIVIAHSWFRSLSGLDYGTGFSPDRILKEYEIALNTVISAEQTELLEPIVSILNGIGIDCTSLQIINRPPVTDKPQYMKVWEARKADGLDYDETDPAQQQFLANLNQKKNETTN